MFFDRNNFFQNEHRLSIRQSSAGRPGFSDPVRHFPFAPRSPFMEPAGTRIDEAPGEGLVEASFRDGKEKMSLQLGMTVRAPVRHVAERRIQRQNNRTFRSTSDKRPDRFFRTDQVGCVEIIVPVHDPGRRRFRDLRQIERATDHRPAAQNGNGVGLQSCVIVAALVGHLFQPCPEEGAVRRGDLFLFQ